MPLPFCMTAQSLSMPNPRGPFTEQQFSSGVPSRAWNAMWWADATRTPSIGVLYVTHRPDHECRPTTELSVLSSISSATIELPVSFSISTLMAIHAIVQQVSMAPGPYGLPVACPPVVNPPLLWRSPSTMLHQMCSNARR